MTTYTTIRRNSLTRIAALLAAATLITEYSDDGMNADSGRCTAERVMGYAERFRSVSLDSESVLSVTLHSNHFFSAYPTEAIARKRLTTQAVRKYFDAAA